MRCAVVQKVSDDEYWIARYSVGIDQEVVKKTKQETLDWLNEEPTIVWDLPTDISSTKVTRLDEAVKKHGFFFTFSDITWNTLNQNRYVGTTKQIHNNIKKGQTNTAEAYLKRDLELLRDLQNFIEFTGYVLGPLAPHAHAMLGTNDILVKMVLDF